MRIQVEYSELKNLLPDNINDRIKDRKTAYVERIGKRLQAEIQSAAGGGEISSWQIGYSGSGGGYAAVAPQRGMSEKGYAYGYITNAYNSGHKIRKPGRSARYKPHIRKAYVPGKHFYQSVASKVETLATQEGRALADEIAKEMEG